MTVVSRAARALAVAVVCSTALLGACSRDEEGAEAPESVPAQVVLDSLKDAGSDLSKPHDVDFTFYFPDVASAQRFITKAGGGPPYEFELSDGEFRVQITRTFIPTLADIEKTSADLAALAKNEGGEFDGWGAAVVN